MTVDVGSPRITVVVPARDAAATLPDTLRGLEAQRFDGAFEVVLVDDGSTDSTAALAAGSPVVTRVVTLTGDGPGRARNAGAASAGTALAFIDADCRPVPGWLAAGAAALAHADLVLGETRPRPDQPCGPFDRSLSVVGLSPLFESANLFVRRELFESLGGFQSWLGPRRGKELGEDVWFGWRARRAGARIASCPDALVHHVVESRGAAEFVAERWRLRYFPALARRIPELRDEFFYRRWFLTDRAAAFDAALLALALARSSRRPAFALAGLPYARLLAQDGRGPGGARVASGRLCADAVGLVALLLGSARRRSVLL
jgi:glycosyltransferase involved in cell wall biosynthesis